MNIQETLFKWADAFHAWRATRKMLSVQEFANQHRNFFVIVCDPKDDSIFASFGGKQVCGTIRSADGLDHRVVENVLRASTFETNVDRMLGGFVELLKTPLKNQRVSDFYKFVDGALYNIAHNKSKE